jgi:CheY-like chemotaxis protein
MEERNKIMIVDESETISLITSKLFEFQHWNVTKALSGEMALEFIQNEDFDVILLDINLPGMTGIECCQLIRKMDDKRKSKTPIFAVTGNDLNLTEKEYKDRGFDEFFQKPTNFHLLVDKLKKILD